jgi:predicted dehydrogenase
MAPLKLRIIGSGKAADKQRVALETLPRRFEVVPSIYKGDVDITSVCTPHFRHFNDVLDAVHDSHVIVEKPMCHSLWHADRLLEAVMMYSHLIFPVFQYRYTNHSTFEDAIIMEFPRDAKYWQTGWRSDWMTGLGGVMAMHGIHGLDLIVNRYGMPSAIQAKLWGPSNIPVETRGLIAMQWQNGSICTLGAAADPDVAKNEEKCPWSLGDSAAGYIHFFERVFLNLYPAETEPPPPVCQFHDGRNAVELLTAIYKSYVLDQWVNLPIRETDPWFRGWAREAQAWYNTPELQSLASH